MVLEIAAIGQQMKCAWIELWLTVSLTSNILWSASPLIAMLELMDANWLVGAVKLHLLRLFTIFLRVPRTSMPPLTLMNVLQTVGIRLGSEDQIITPIEPELAIIP